MSPKYIALLCLLSAILSGALVKNYWPTSKIVEVDKTSTKTDVVTVIHTVTTPSGVTDSTTTITDHTKKIEVDSKPTLNLSPEWIISGTYSTNIHNLQPIYGLEVQRTILGPLVFSALLNTKGDIGLGLGLKLHFN